VGEGRLMIRLEMSRGSVFIGTIQIGDEVKITHVPFARDLLYVGA
jgi:hypothetical protein